MYEELNYTLKPPHRLHDEDMHKKIEEDRDRLMAEGITGTLFNVWFNEYKGDIRYPNLAGKIDVDTKRRFYFGDTVYTSQLEKIYVKDGRTFAKTKFSLYELIGFDPTDIPEDFKYAFENV